VAFFIAAVHIYITGSIRNINEPVIEQKLHCRLKAFTVMHLRHTGKFSHKMI
jgi:hypothetical protein